MSIDKECKCTNIKLYDGKYRCIWCFKEYIADDTEAVMNTMQAAPAIARIQELEQENSTLREAVNAMKKVLAAIKAPIEIQEVFVPEGVLEDD